MTEPTLAEPKQVGKALEMLAAVMVLALAPWALQEEGVFQYKFQHPQSKGKY